MRGDDQQYSEMLSLRSRSKRLAGAVQVPAELVDRLPPEVIVSFPQGGRRGSPSTGEADSEPDHSMP
jgi:hypothetical protein